jgi:hypothetical protein
MVFLRSDGRSAVIGLAGYKELPVEPDSVKNNTVNILVDYIHNVYSIALGNREVLRSAKLSSTFTAENITIGTNQIGYPHIAPIFPALLRRTDGACKARDTRSRDCLPRRRACESAAAAFAICGRTSCHSFASRITRICHRTHDYFATPCSIAPPDGKTSAVPGSNVLTALPLRVPDVRA